MTLIVGEGYTPGPWTWRKRRAKEQEPGEYYLVGSAEVPMAYRNSARLLDGNCRLIAAAPDLLEACQEAVKHLGQYAEAIAHGDCPPLGLYLADDGRKPLMPILLAAIAKATVKESA